ncbi:hypothetical protein SLS62_011436, partial [Diatrype stigma]
SFCGIKRFYMHGSVYDVFMAAMLGVLQRLKPDDGFADGVFIPPLTNVQQFERVRELLAEVEREGSKIAARNIEPLLRAGKD